MEPVTGIGSIKGIKSENVLQKGIFIMHIVVTANAFGTEKVIELGQSYFVPIVSAAGGSGIEIRRELFIDFPFPLQDLAKLITRHSLTAVYSAPDPVWLHDGSLNESVIQDVIQEGIVLGSSILKMSLGNYDESYSNMQSLYHTLKPFSLNDRGIQFTVENDQTAKGGNLENIARFLADCRSSQVPVKMTFDIGNWKWTNTNVFQAATQLKEDVVYIHCKHVVELSGLNHSLPLPEDKNSPWRMLLSLFSSEIPRAIEFPIKGGDLTQRTAKYVHLLAETEGAEI
jgi:sugar phosphate isomerase/epimerase